ncbi:hypothetical protein SAMN04489712_11994 [Thermomonospora echinospora]|uniref:Uncharacterized protein n=1 Tax=Thermomonospora echinospora TaxID=1992 RepID=A0A1H6DML7_9ACTN|nr:hypothetical protein [Thermomonospora echinospora]SEG86488.1 hypothetical protein SAMN04489712_11994 [Thermomonospora echinospora]
MLRLEGALDLPEAAIWGDDASDTKFYVLPKVPVLRRNGERAAFQFLKYRTPQPMENGKLGAGLVFMDIALSLTAQQQDAVRQQLARLVQTRRGPGAAPVDPAALELARPTLESAAVTVEILADSQTLVQRVNHAGRPSGFGDNVVAVSAELTQLGATVFEAAMQGQGPGGVRVVYDLTFLAKLPPVSAVGTWRATKFYSFVQEVDFEENFYTEDDFTEKISEIFHNSESREVTIDSGHLDSGDEQDRKLLDLITDTVTRQLDEAVKRNLLEAIPPESRDFSKIRDDDFENIRREVMVNKSSDVTIRFTQNMVTAVPALPQANIPSLTSQGFTWTEYATEIDTEDAFFQQFVLPVQVNAEFDKLPIFSVDVSIDYAPDPIETFTFRDTDTLHKFTKFRDGRPNKYRYRYVVNYKGHSRTMDSGWKDGEGDDLKINIDALGLWAVDVELGDLDFEQVDHAVLTLEHPTVAPGVPSPRTLRIDQETVRHPENLRVREVLLQPAQPYGGSIRYVMKDGRELVRDLHDLTANVFPVDDPFSGIKQVRVVGRGDFARRIDSIIVDFSYVDEANRYRQTPSVALTQDERFREISFPVIDENAGTFTYQATILYRDGRTADSGVRPVEGRTLQVGEQAQTLQVRIIPDLVDWERVRLVTFELHPTGGAVDEREAFTFRRGSAEVLYELAIGDARKEYTWQATYFMADGSRSDLGSDGPVDREQIVLPEAG